MQRSVETFTRSGSRLLSVIDRPPPQIVGRLEELRLLDSVLSRAASGTPSVTFVHGEAGIGKTYLAREAADRARAGGVEVLWGQCVRFGGGESPMLPWVLALERWLAEAAPTDRADVESAPAAARLLPSLGGGDGDDSTRLAQVADSIVSRIVERHPVLLVLDDVQWADAASRDTLTYLVAGLGADRLAVVVTYRDEGLPPGDPLHGWIGDLRRMPGVGEVRLGRLDRDETEQQLEHLLGGPPTPRLVDHVMSRSGGNAYLTELLVHGLSAEAEELPEGLPVVLSDALLAAWHRLSAPARETVRVLAVAGRPAPVELLAEVSRTCGLSGGVLVEALAEATVDGIVVGVGSGSVWLRHPLLADVLYESYPPGGTVLVHRAWAAALAGTTAVGVAEVRRLGDLARHSQGAGEPGESFRASMAAAGEAARGRLWRQEALHLRRATELWPVPRAELPSLDEAELFERAFTASSRVGDDLEGLRAGEHALELARAAGDPVRTSRLTIRCAEVAWWLGLREGQPLEEQRLAVELTRDFPDSPEHAQALAARSVGLAWEGRFDEAAAVADAALKAALRSGSVETLSDAYGARGFAALEGGRADHDTRLALELAVQCGDVDRTMWAYAGRINFLIVRGRLVEATALAEATVQWALDNGAVAGAGWHSAALAKGLADQGRLRASAAAIRVGLSLVGPGNANAAIRLSAIVVAVRQGDLRTAGLHRQRAAEQIASLEERPGLEAPPMLAELLCARAEPRDAIDLIRRTMAPHSVDPQVADVMLLWGARAAADLVEGARLTRRPVAVALARDALAGLVSLRDSLPGSVFAVVGPDDSVRPAQRALFEAEVARCTSGQVDPDAWDEAARLCRLAGLGWERWTARWRSIQALVAAGASRSVIAGALREVYRFSRSEGAGRLLRDVEDLARLARISLDDVQIPTQPSARTSFPHLTGREREVLAHLVAGRTYAEIAEALFISEKTVSVHVSHLISKTGAKSGREVAALALRLGEVPG